MKKAEKSLAQSRASTPQKVERLCDAFSVFQWMLKQFEEGSPRTVPKETSDIPTAIAESMRLYGRVLERCHPWEEALMSGFFPDGGVFVSATAVVQLPNEMAILCYQLCIEFACRGAEFGSRGEEFSMGYREIFNVMLTCHNGLMGVHLRMDNLRRWRLQLSKKDGRSYGVYFNIAIPQPSVPIFVPLR